MGYGPSPGDSAYLNAVLRLTGGGAPEQSEDEAYVQRMLRLAEYGQGPAPMPQRPTRQGINIGPFSISGDALDSGALNALNALEGVQPRGFAQGLATGLVRGMATRRVRGAARDEQGYQAQAEAAQKENDSRRIAAREFVQGLAIDRRQQAARAREATSGPRRITADINTPEGRANRALYKSATGNELPPSWKDMPEEWARGDKFVGQPNSEIDLDPETLAAWSQATAQMGGLPSGVSRFGKITEKLMKGAVPFLKSGESIGGNRAAYQANASALSKATNSYTTQKVFIDTANKNADVVANTMKLIKDSGTRWQNRPVRALASGLGSKRQSDFNAALTILRPEFARILQGGVAMGGQLTDRAAEEMKAVLSGDYTVPQLEGSIEILKQDSQNRIASWQGEINFLRSQVGLPSLDFYSPGAGGEKSAKPDAESKDRGAFSGVRTRPASGGVK